MSNKIYPIGIQNFEKIGCGKVGKGLDKASYIASRP